MNKKENGNKDIFKFGFYGITGFIIILLCIYDIWKCKYYDIFYSNSSISNLLNNNMFVTIIYFIIGIILYYAFAHVFFNKVKSKFIIKALCIVYVLFCLFSILNGFISLFRIIFSLVIVLTTNFVRKNKDYSYKFCDKFLLIVSILHCLVIFFIGIINIKTMHINFLYGIESIKYYLIFIFISYFVLCLYILIISCCNKKTINNSNKIIIFILKNSLDSILYLFSIYILISSILFVNQSVVLKNNLSKTINISLGDNLKNTIINSKVLINKYKLNGKDSLCLSSVEKYLDLSYKKNNLGKVTLKEFTEKYLGYDLLFLPPVYENCNFTEETKTEFFRTADKKNALVTKFARENLVSYEINFKIKDYFVNYPEFSIIEKNARETFELRLQDIEENIILKIMEYLGEKYE